VGCIIGKGGSKINEIRSLSASQIRIMEPGVQGPPGTAPGNPNERLVIITGQPQNIQMAVNLLYHVSASSVQLFRSQLKKLLFPAPGARKTKAAG
jgi:hypothetical protein